MFHVKHFGKFLWENSVSRETLNAKKSSLRKKKQSKKTMKSKKPDKYVLTARKIVLFLPFFVRKCIRKKTPFYRIENKILAQNAKYINLTPKKINSSSFSSRFSSITKYKIR